jgi:hypothetical protein
MRGERDIEYFDERPWPRFSDEERKEILEKGGRTCFLLTPTTSTTRNMDKYKFPVCRPDVKHCHVDAYGVLAARKRAFLTGQYPQLAEELTSFIETFRLTKKSRNVPSRIPKCITKSMEGGLLLINMSHYFSFLDGKPTKKHAIESKDMLVWIEKVPDFTSSRKKKIFTFRILLPHVPYHLALHKKKTSFSKPVSILIPSLESFQHIQIQQILQLDE